MRYLKRHWNERRGDEFDSWGTSTFYFEVDDELWSTRQIIEYENGILLKYSEQKTFDEFGGLADQQIEYEEYIPFEIKKEIFEDKWNQMETLFIKSRFLGFFYQNKKINNWWESSTKIELPLLQRKKLSVTLEGFNINEKKFINEIDYSIANLRQKDEKEFNSLSTLLYKHYQDFIQQHGITPNDNINNRNIKSKIWEQISLNHIYITRRPKKDKDIYVRLVGGCSWDKEHGIQIVYRQGKRVTRISGQDGHATKADAFGIPDKEDDLLSQFNDLYINKKKYSVFKSLSNWFKKEA